ncbi:hypothetical protein GCM10022631_05700 [Deinococcus rubellus]|uniref:NPCBM-associated, NEW3 domain of alpha-galactosidase n=1 Tax=Deinococcus rubellus TaxID=1889240 RepID=A0ABY5YG78_9DEIO|nr:hypothetical protein [Deinococcus rubellus]UWX64080.1 hypothetical protein N0D28_15425 [Deinococcus rubellus]
MPDQNARWLTRLPRLRLGTALPLSLLALSLLGAPALAQTGGVLPLASVGEKWPIDIETYIIQVPAQDANKPLGLEVYSPTLNLTDYVDGRRTKAEGYFGDELYQKNVQFSTTFTLSSATGQVFERTFGMNREHTWESLWASGLPAGTYTLKVNSTGDGKNSFALRVASPFVIETSDFTVNARDTEQRDLLVARLTVPAGWVGKTLSVTNYDVDGPKEAKTWVVEPGNKRVDLPSSDNGKYATVKFPITPALVGEWTVYIKVLPTTKQYSNAVTYSFRLDNKPIPARIGGFTPPTNAKISSQLLVDVVDTQGQPIAGASYTVGGDNVVRPVLPGGYVPVSADVLKGKGNVISPTELRYTPGDVKLRFVARPPYKLLVDVVDPQGRPIPGASYVEANDNSVRPVLPPGYVPVSATVIQGSGNVISPTELRYKPGDVKLRFVARPPEGSLSIDSVAIYGNQRIPLTGVPFTLGGKTYSTPTTLPLQPGDYPVGPTQIPGSGVRTPPPGHVVDGTTGRVTIEYTPRTEVTLLTTPDVLNACDVTQLTASAKTDFPYKLPATLNLNLPAGWTSDYPLSLRGDLSASTPLRLKVPVRVCRTDSAEAALDPVNLRTTGQARVRSPGGSNITRNVEQGARAGVAKSIEAIEGGYTVTLQITADSTLENVQITDPLPSGSQTLVRGPVTVNGPSLANLSPRVEGDIITLSRVIPGTYTLTYQLLTSLPAEQILTPPDIRW